MLQLLEKPYRALVDALDILDFHEIDKLLIELEITALPDGGQLNSISMENFYSWLSDFEEKKIGAIKGHIPAILISSMPRSASVFLSYKLSELTNAPVCSLTNHSNRENLIKSNLRSFSLGGNINHDHFLPTKLNIKRLNEVNLNAIVLQLRDPRDFLVSIFHKIALEEKSKTSPEQVCRTNFAFNFSSVAQYLKMWAEFTSNQSSIRILPIWHSDLVNEPVSAISSVLKFFGSPELERKQIYELCAVENPTPGEYNFRNGVNGLWAEFLTKSEIEICNNMLKEIILKFDNPIIKLRENLRI